MPLVYSQAGIYARRNKPMIHVEEFIQEGVIGLINAIRKYDPSIGKFSTYAVWWIRQRMSNYCKKHYKQQISKIPFLGEVVDNSRKPLYSFEEIEDLKNQLNKLNKKHKDILLLRGQGYTLQEISMMYEITRERIRQIELQAYTKLMRLMK